MWHLPKNGKQVVLAQAVEVDVLHDHHLVIIDREERVVHDGVDVGGIAARQEPERFLDPFGGVAEPLARRVLAKLRQQLPDDFLHPRIVHVWFGSPKGLRYAIHC